MWIVSYRELTCGEKQYSRNESEEKQDFEQEKTDNSEYVSSRHYFFEGELESYFDVCLGSSTRDSYVQTQFSK